MAQHFLLSAAARSLSLSKVLRMTDVEAWEAFKAIRWDSTGGDPVCPRCGSLASYELSDNRRFKCADCRHKFSVTSGTIFASRKMDLRDILAAVAIFVNGAKGHSALQLSRDLDCQYKSAFVLLHKLREAMVAQQAGAEISGELAVDGAYFGGYIKPANIKAERRDRRRKIYQTGKRQVVIVARELDGDTATHVAKSGSRWRPVRHGPRRGRLNRPRRRSQPLGHAPRQVPDQAHQSQ